MFVAYMEDIENNSSSEDEWEGVEDGSETIPLETLCLFCPEIFNTPEIMFHHCHSQHMFDIFSFSKKMSLNSISYIKFINFMRLNHPSSSQLLDIPVQNKPWSGDEFMKPSNTLDPLLMFDFEGFVEEKTSEREGLDDNITLPQSQFEAVLQKLAAKELQLQHAMETVQKMKEAAHTVLFSNAQPSAKDDSERLNSEAEDDSYFSTYDHFAIHHEMLQDKVRTSSYQNAILNNKEKFMGKTVMDVGCGTSILSMFAASAGAVRVIGIDKSDVIYHAMDIVRENGYGDVIDLFKGRVEDVVLPDNKVDIIISEWMGYFLLFEGMLDSVVYARNKYLIPGGLMFPDRCNLSVLAISDAEKHEEYVGFWDNVYGYKMSVMKREVIKEANVESVKGNSICSNTVIVKELDLMTCSLDDGEFVSNFELIMTQNCKVTAIVGYFDSIFERGLNHKVLLSTSPATCPTHWKQTVFLLPEPIAVSIGDQIPGKISCRRNRRDPRTLIIKITFGNCHHQYYLA